MTEKIEELLSGLRPAPAPREMDDAVFAAVEKHAASRRAARRRLILAPAFAAAILAALALAFIAMDGLRPPDVSRGVAAAKGQAVPEPGSELLAAKAKLLEMKLATLRRIAKLSDADSAEVSELDTLEAELKAIGDLLENENPKPDESMKPALTGGKTNV
jgi:hypothetical protein